MPLYLAEHTHRADQCPATNPQMAQGLLQIIHGASEHGIQVRGDAVTAGAHHLYLIVDAPSEQAVREYFAPFGQMGILSVQAASHCEEVVARGAC
jgi:hypothetical protein